MATVLMAISIPIFWTNKKIGGLFIGVSIIASLARVYIGIHYPFDIMGGFILALAAAVAAIYILKILGKYVDLFLKMLQKVCLA
jgi:undecaprenyl-diphosphatase